MQELERITTIRITEIEKNGNKKLVDFVTSDVAKETYKNNMELSLKKILGVDDVKVINVQDFVREV